MNQRDEDHLRGLLQESVSDVDPDHRLDEIRRRTAGAHRPHDPYSTKVTTMPATTPRRSWMLGALGAAVATAAVIGVVVVLTHGSDSPAPAAATTSPVASATDPGASTEPSVTPSSPGGGAEAMGVYYVGDGPRGPRLFREFHRVVPAEAVAQAAEPPQDPDYRTDWQPGDIVSSSHTGSLIQVEMSSPSLASRPAGMTSPEAAMALQSLVYTAQATYQSRDQVQFTVDANPMSSLYGVTLEGPLKAASPIKTLSLMSITAPEEGQAISGTLEASGVSNGPEANVGWQLKQGDRVVKSGFTTAEAWMGDKLYPWRTTISLADLPAGTYTFVAANDDPSGGEGGGTDSDTRTVVVG